MYDQYTDVKERSAGENWFLSLLIPIVGVSLLLFCLKYQIDNEYAAAEMKGALKTSSGLVAELTPSTAANLEGKLVHFSSIAHANAPVQDPVTGATFAALVVNRKVEMFQWREDEDTNTEKKFGGGTRTISTYRYDRAWSDQLIDSNKFAHSLGHANPTSMPISAATIPAARVTVGSYVVPTDLLSKLQTNPQLLAVSPALAAQVARKLHDKTYAMENVLYIGENPSAPQVGDLKVSYRQASAGTPVTVIAQKYKNTFVPFHPDKSKAAVYLIEPGDLKSGDMFKMAQKKQDEDLFGKRCLALLMTFVAILFFAMPLSQLFDTVPFIGDLFDRALTPTALVLAALTNGIMIAGIWLRYDPIFSGEIVLGIWVACLILMMFWKLILGLLRRLGLVSSRK